MARFPRRRTLLILLGLVLLVLVPLARLWKANADKGGQQPAEPFRIAGNVYYVGANDISAFLITGPEGHVLLDGGYPGTPPLIMASIEKLGFRVEDVAVLINSEPHLDHAGGLAELQEATGAELWASQASAPVLAAGGDDPDVALPLRALIWLGVIRYRAPRVDRRFSDGETLHVGPIELTPHVTGGHTRGCTSWSLPVREGERTLNVVSACSLLVLGGSRYEGQVDDLERSIQTLRELPADVWFTSHARLWGRWAKFTARDTAESPVAPFIDPEGYRAYVDSAAARLRRGVVH